jgi:septal ring factor EnvC (AmiA/AmiB activator)
MVLADDYDDLSRKYADAVSRAELLAAELAGVKDELYSVDKAAKELGAERDRLRAALESIDEYWNGHEGAAHDAIVECSRFAREALSASESPDSL